MSSKPTDTRKLLPALMIAGISLATAWAIRGQFGHEQGAAWAGAIGGLSVILLAKRPDWYAKAFHATLASAAGWGVGGMISYGLLVGYGRGTDFGNVYYGLLMLFVVGGLFGLLGGGLFGLTLADNKQKPINWPTLVVEMAVGGLVFYLFLVSQLGWKMTPPRAENWAVCLGMSVAMFWYMIRNKQYAPLRVALMAGFGAGFGFAFGNFLQVMGNVSGISFNFWNVMEYSIGFFGGIGMAYGTFTSNWEASEPVLKKGKILVPLLLVTVLFPFIVWQQSFTASRITRSLEGIGFTGNSDHMIGFIQWGALALLLIMLVIWLRRFYFRPKEGTITLTYDKLSLFFLEFFGLYAVYSILITAAFLSAYRIEQYLYLINLAVVGLLIGKVKADFTEKGLSPNRWGVNFIIALIFIALLAWIAINLHDGLGGMQKRF